MTARGIRNKNPGNLDKGDAWQGLDPEGKDPRFCVFKEMKYGIRALIKTLITYTTKRGCKTVRDIINRWAPSNENNTQAYIESVAKAINKEPDEVLDFSNTSLYLEIAKAIAKHENGKDAELISTKDWLDGYGLVFSN